MRILLTVFCLMALMLVPVVSPVSGAALAAVPGGEAEQTAAAINHTCDQSGVSASCGATLAVLTDTGWHVPSRQADRQTARGDTIEAHLLASPNSPPPRRQSS